MARVTGALTGTTQTATSPPVRPPLLTKQTYHGHGPAATVFVDTINTKTAVYDLNVAFGGTAQQTFSNPGTAQWLCPPGITTVYVECFGGGGPGYGDTTGNAGYKGGGGGAFAARVAVPVTPGTLYTFTVGAGGTSPNTSVGPAGGDTTFTGDSSTQVLAKGGAAGSGQTGGGTGGAAASSVGDVGNVFSGGDGANGGAPPHNGGGGGASGNRVATGAAGAANVGGTGANGGGSGGNGASIAGAAAQAGSSPGGGGGGGSSASTTRRGNDGADGQITISCGVVCPFIGSVTVVNALTLATIPLPFISSHTTLYGPSVQGYVSVPFISSTTSVHAPTLPVVAAPFISSNTTVYALTLTGPLNVPFISSVTSVYTPTLIHVEVDVPFIASSTTIFDLIVTTLEVDVPFIDSVTIVYTPNLMATFTGGGVSQVALEVAAALTDGDAFVSQVTLEIVVPNYKGLHVWQRS